ncbi:MAG TPA: 50S ribosomal protein L30 [Anaerolineae bacterium]|jgi:large subunit ribosomal protein L30
MAAALTANETGGVTKRLLIRWVKSAIGYNVRQKRTLKALGLTKLGQVVEHADTPQMRGMINAVTHLVQVEEKK